MRNDRLNALSVGLAVGLATGAVAQNEPLSVIDWVQRSPQSDVRAEETPPDPQQGALPPSVAVESLDAQKQRLVGLVPARVSGLPETLWQNSLADRLQTRLTAFPELRVPAAQSLLYAILLTEAFPPRDAGPQEDLFTVSRVRTLLRLGALDPAAALAEQVGMDRDPLHFAAYMDVALLAGSEDSACAILQAKPHLSPGLAHRIFCAVRAGDWALAVLLFDTGQALDVFSGNLAAALQRFIDPEFADGADMLPKPLPREISPLLFRLYEALGEPLPTRGLPPAYAHADLRDISGWKAQLEAAERLARVGALSANQLLGLYTERRPAASGGIWDRVTAVQRFDTALSTGSADAVAKTLPDAWDAMRAAGLGAPFAALFSEPLSTLSLAGDARRVATELALITPGTAGQAAVAELMSRFPAHPLARAMSEGLEGGATRADLVALARDGRLGEALLDAIGLLEAGAAGDPVALSASLSTLQALDQKPAARLAAAQILVLELFP